jgi:phage N-6-adenine-methyltransferase
MNKDLLFSSDKMDWGTPQDFFDKLHEEFIFDIDVCASDWNAKLLDYWTVADDALSLDWTGLRCFMNPPYGRELKVWIKKAYEESLKGALVVALIPARTDTSYFHDYIFGKAEVRFIRGMIKFERPEGAADAAPFPSAVVVWRGEC